MGSSFGRFAVACACALVPAVPAAAQNWLGTLAKAEDEAKEARARTTQIGSWTGIRGDTICTIRTTNPAGETLRYVVRAGPNGRMVQVDNAIAYSGDGTTQVAFQFDNVIWDQDMIASDDGDLIGADRNDARIGRAIRRSAQVKTGNAQGKLLGWTKLTGADEAMDWVEACAGVPSTRTTPRAAPKPAPVAATVSQKWSPLRSGKICVVMRRDVERRSMLAVARQSGDADRLTLLFQYPAVPAMAEGTKATLRIAIDGRSSSVPLVRTASGLQAVAKASALAEFEAGSAVTVQDAAGKLLFVADYAGERSAFASVRACPAA